MRTGRADFERAVAAYPLDGPRIPDEVIAAGRASLAATGLFLVGEWHGAAETPAVVRSLARALGTQGVAVEWSHDELDSAVQPLRDGGALDLDALWRLPEDVEAFCGDGRFTAGHVAVLQHLRAEGLLEQLLLVDRSGPAEVDQREEAMAKRLLAGRRVDVATLVWLGGFHVLLEPLEELVPLGARVRSVLPALQSVQIAFDRGTVWFHGEREIEDPRAWPGLVLRLPLCSPATVPGHM